MNEGPTILVIDDNPTDLKLIASILASKGYNVSAISDAPEGIESIMKIMPALIVLDVMMPIINGYNVCRLIKDQKEYAHIPIILLTSRTTEDDHRIGREAGANAYMRKPFKSQELLSLVERFVNLQDA